MMGLFCFFKQKTAYEMRISDWSADVCSSDLVDEHPVAARGARCDQRLDRGNDADADDDEVGGDDFAVRQPNTGDALGDLDRFDRDAAPPANGRASGRNRGCKYD